METALILLILILVLAVGFDFVNGFHDTANAIATVVATRVLTPTQAIIMASSLNFAGAMTGTAVAKTIASGLVPTVYATHYAVIAALLAAIIWNLITWYWGIPSSSSHALIGGILGAVIAEAGFSAPLWPEVIRKVILPLVISPIVGFAFALAIMVVLLRLFIKQTPSHVQRTFGKLQVLSSAFMAFSHGSNDAQKTMGIMTLALASYAPAAAYFKISPENLDVPTIVKLTAAIAMGCGTAMGGWRIIKTMGHKMAKLQPIHGFAAETAAATVIEIASRLGFPLSTTHVISSAILGAGASRRANAVKWNVAGSIVTAWVLTIPTCMILAWALFSLMHLLFPAAVK
jgi:PiT family inorganic phosphate transporter